MPFIFVNLISKSNDWRDIGRASISPAGGVCAHFEIIQKMCVKWAAVFSFVLHFCQHKPHREPYALSRPIAQYAKTQFL